jgi:Carboxypeptidase regulatory-like domain
MSSNIREIKVVFNGLQTLYETYLPKADPILVHDLLLREQENPKDAPFYMVEVFTKPGTNSQAKRDLIFNKTGMIPAIYDNGTHYVANHRLTSEMLEQICKDDDVLEVTGEYTGGIGGWGASHEHREHRRKQEDEYDDGSSFSQHDQQQEQLLMKQQTLAEKGISKEVKRKYNQTIVNKSNYKPIIYTAIGILGAITLAGFIISGGLLPNVNKGTVTSSPSSNIPVVLGAIYGHVSGPAGLPAVGATVVAAEQQTGHTVNSIISIDGNYYFEVPAGEYNVMAAFPDGTHKTISNFEVRSGVAQTHDFIY